MVKRTFTFGQGQENPVTGRTLRDHYVEIEGETAEHCRATMLNHWGQNWSFDYDSPEAAGKERFNLVELPRDQWPMSSGKYFVDAQGVCRPAMRSTQSVLGNSHGREDSINADKCIAPPIGCGTQYTREQIIMWPDKVQSEYTISGTCKNCQAKYFETPTECTCDDPCCEADVGVGVINCGSQHCPVHGDDV